MDLLIDQDFSIFHNSEAEGQEGKKDLMFTRDEIQYQKQRLFIFLNIYKGTLCYNRAWGFDYEYFLKLARINNRNAIISYLEEICHGLKLIINQISVDFVGNILKIVFYFPTDRLYYEVET